MRTVSAREANQRFSRLLKAAAAGEHVVITVRGRPVARLSPFGTASGQEMDAQRAQAIDRMMAQMRRGIGGRAVPFTRDELYER